MMLTKNDVGTRFSVHFSLPQNIVGRLTCLLRSRCSVAIACLLFSQAAFAGKKQVFISDQGNKVEVEVEAIENEAKIYEEAGVLYLVPGHSYKFMQTALPARDWSVVGKKGASLVGMGKS